MYKNLKSWGRLEMTRQIWISQCPNKRFRFKIKAKYYSREKISKNICVIYHLWGYNIRSVHTDTCVHSWHRNMTLDMEYHIGVLSIPEDNNIYHFPGNTRHRFCIDTRSSSCCHTFLRDIFLHT